MSRVVATGTLAVCLVAGVVARAAAQVAQASAEAIKLEFEAPPDCGTADDFFAALLTRTEHVRRSEGRDEERRFTIRILQTATGFDGRLSVVDRAADEPATIAPQQSSERRITAARCADVVDALSIVAALAIDANREQTAASSAPIPSAPAIASAIVPPEVPSSAPVPGPPPMPPTADAGTSARDNSTPLPLSWALGVQLGVDLAEPRAVAFPSGAITGDVSLDSARVFSPSLRLAVRYSLDATVSSTSGHATFGFTAGRLEPCPIRLSMGAVASLLPCAVLDVGALRANGEGVNRQQSPVRPWVTIGGALRSSFALGRGRLILDLEAGVLAAVQRDEFQFLPDETIYQFSGPIFFFAAGTSFGWPSGAQ